MSQSPQDVTQLLHNWRNGDSQAFDRLLPLVHDELRRIASRYMRRERAGHTLQTTALVNEAYLRLVGQKNVAWQDRAHFYAVAAQVMRHLLVDHARRRHYAKRGGNAQRITLDETAVVSSQRDDNLLALDEALTKLAEIDPRKVKLVELRYFGGLSAEETAEVLGVSEITVKREWLKTKAWLYRELTGEAGDEA
jgi:RNA polymerase sigma factor (TIGR02999 family)